jgi:DNA-binding MarR family transcriptional regulator
MSLEDDLGWTLGVVFRAYLRSATAVTEGLPGGHRGYQVLTAAARSAPGSQSALGRQLGVDRTVMTYLLDDLERAGLVERRPAPGDRRTRHVVATPRGQELLDELDARLAHAEEHLLAGLPEAERATFKSLLCRLATHANALDPVTDACAIVDEIAATHP